MELWSNGATIKTGFQPNTPTLQHSSTPLLRYSPRNSNRRRCIAGLVIILKCPLDQHRVRALVVRNRTGVIGPEFQFKMLDSVDAHVQRAEQSATCAGLPKISGENK